MDKQAYRVVTSNVDEMNEKIHRHRRRVLLLTVLVAVLLLGTVIGAYIYLQTRHYTEYDVLDSMQREDSDGTQFAVFNGNIIKYNKDGATCIGMDNHMLWNQTYEMQSPMVDTCEGYAVIADKKGEKIYIMDMQGPCGEIKTTMPIQRVQVANQGTVAILMEQDGTGYLHMYDRKGVFLAEGEVHTENNGYPLDITISNNGKKMAVSLLDVNEGNVKTTIVFFDFDSAGQESIDNIVGRFSYADMVFPQVEYLANNVMAAFGSGKTVIFGGNQEPQVNKEITAEAEIRSIFYNDTHLGYVYANDNGEAPYRMQVFGMDGKEVFSQDFNVEYEEIEFLENGEICVRGDLECAIYTLRGWEKFHGNFEKNIQKILPAGGIRDYIFIKEGETQRIRLK
ncbi:MAG: hypothetical protein HFH36_03725 [Lachnospiraceae bacterium]|nr:hypothetical protein [Lachnospiraceae bacterium]